MSNESRYLIGIDLGTTNSALAYVDTSLPASERTVQTLAIPQLVAPGEVEALPTLPSFVYLPEPHEADPELLRLPWSENPPDYCVGAYARDMAAQAPGKVVSSAKSWLCVPGLDRRTPVLPWDRNPVPRQLSPVDASRLYLQHIRDAWNHAMAGDDASLRLEHQETYLTVPASFDAVARELTVEAAQDAGLQVRLLEEPQAAFYAWLQAQGENWRAHVTAGDMVLVCDIGGGTTDFSLIAVTDQDGALALERIAVGDHILLGGDNMDLTMAYAVAERLRTERNLTLDAYQLAALTHACRQAKERIGEEEPPKPQTLTILGRGTGVVGGTVTAELTADDLAAVLLDGFFPRCDIADEPAARRRLGLRTLGLEYASDPGVTRHLAAFLTRHSFRDASGKPLLPQAVLFNGGVTKSTILRDRIIDVLQAWNQDSGKTSSILTEAHPDLAVSIGAAWYGHVRREGGVRIRSGSARSYYIGVESSQPAVPGYAPPLDALCVVSFGMEEGTAAEVPAEGLGLVVGELTEFRFFSSTVRHEDTIGDVLEAWAADELAELPPLVAELSAEEQETSPIGTLVPVRLHTVLTEVGTLQVWCHATRGSGRWKLEFELRSADAEEQG